LTITLPAYLVPAPLVARGRGPGEFANLAGFFPREATRTG
jgi:hypothetical protein